MRSPGQCRVGSTAKLQSKPPNAYMAQSQPAHGRWQSNQHHYAPRIAHTTNSPTPAKPTCQPPIHSPICKALPYEVYCRERPFITSRCSQRNWLMFVSSSGRREEKNCGRPFLINIHQQLLIECLNATSDLRLAPDLKPSPSPPCRGASRGF